MLKQLSVHHLPDFPVEFFASGQAFLDALPTVSPRSKLILLDRHMLPLDGHQTLLRLKEVPAFQTIPVLMMSAEPTPLEIEGCYRANASGFVLKHPDLDFFKQSLLSVLDFLINFNL